MTLVHIIGFSSGFSLICDAQPLNTSAIEARNPANPLPPREEYDCKKQFMCSRLVLWLDFLMAIRKWISIPCTSHTDQTIANMEKHY